MRVSVTITDEMNEYFKMLAEEKGISKDKAIGEILNKALSTKHNERGAGRKPIFGDTEICKMKELKEQGYSYRKIAKEFKCSAGLVHKLISEQ